MRRSSESIRVLVAGLVVVTGALASVQVTTANATSSAASCDARIEYCTPGPLHAGLYTTRYFLPGMRVHVPGSGWTSTQDSVNEFKLSPPGYADPNIAPVIRFWIDPQVSTPCTDRLLPMKLTTPRSAVRWFTTDKNFAVSATGRARLAGHIAALTVDYDVSRSAPTCNPACPGPCIDYFQFLGGPGPDNSSELAPTHTRGIKDGFGTGFGDAVRLYFADIGPSGHSHLFVVGVEIPGGTDLSRVRAEASTMLATLRLPAILPLTGERCGQMTKSLSRRAPKGACHDQTSGEPVWYAS